MARDNIKVKAEKARKEHQSRNEDERLWGVDDMDFLRHKSHKEDYHPETTTDHIVDVMYPHRSDSLFNRWFKESFPQENHASYVRQWEDIFDLKDKEKNVQPDFTHNDDHVAITNPFYKMDGRRRQIYVDLKKKQLDEYLSRV